MTEYLARILVWFAGSMLFIGMAVVKSTFASLCVLIVFLVLLDIVLFRIPEKKSGKK